MAMSVCYTNFCGLLVHENRGGQELDYVPDTLGSCTKAYTEEGAAVFSIEYRPYGEVRFMDGENTTPWGFVGLLGYFKDLTNFLYVRARYYLAKYGRWLTVDPLWPLLSTYAYGRGNPTVLVDPSGKLPGYGRYCGPRNGPGEPINDVDDCCAEHDVCLGRPCDWFWPPLHRCECECNLAFCIARNASDCGWDLHCWCAALAIFKYAIINCAACPTQILPIPIIGWPPGLEDLCIVFG